MSTLLEQAMTRLRQLPPDRQDEIAELILSMLESDHESTVLFADQIAEVERRLAKPDGFVTHEAVRAFFKGRTA